MMFKDKNVYDEIVKQFGHDFQLLKVCEELTELKLVVLQSLTKKDEFKKYDLISEMADVYISLQHLHNLFNVTDQEIKIMANEKFKRLGL